MQDINQWRKVHLIPSPTLQKPSSTELVSLHYKSDRRHPKLCCKYPAYCSALIESMHQKPRQREVLSPCTHCPASTEIHRAGMFEGCTQRRRGMWKMRGGHACEISSSWTSHSTACSHITFSPFRKLLKSKLCFGVQRGFSLWCSRLLWQGHLTCLHKSSSKRLVRAGVSTYKDSRATRTSTCS